MKLSLWFFFVQEYFTRICRVIDFFEPNLQTWGADVKSIRDESLRDSVYGANLICDFWVRIRFLNAVNLVYLLFVFTDLSGSQEKSNSCWAQQVVGKLIEVVFSETCVWWLRLSISQGSTKIVIVISLDIAIIDYSYFRNLRPLSKKGPKIFFSFSNFFPLIIIQSYWKKQPRFGGKSSYCKLSKLLQNWVLFEL